MAIERGIFLVPWSGIDVKAMMERLETVEADFISFSVKDSMGRAWTQSDVAPRWALERDVLHHACEAVDRAGMKVRVSIAVFADTFQGQAHPEWVAVGSDGVPASRPGWWEDWYYHLCPTRSGQRDYLLRFVNELVSRYPIDGIDLDFIRFPWKGNNQDGPEREFCFCDTCRDEFSRATGASSYELERDDVRSQWYTWRGNVISSLVEQVAEITRPRGLALAPFIALWTSDGFGMAELTKAHKRFGQDHKRLGEVCSQLSPMLYHRFTDEPTCYTSRTIRWVRDMTWHLNSLGANVCSVIQGGPPAFPLEVIDAVRGSADAGAVSVMSYPGWSWTVENEYWVNLEKAYRELADRQRQRSTIEARR